MRATVQVIWDSAQLKTIHVDQLVRVVRSMVAIALNADEVTPLFIPENITLEIFRKGPEDVLAGGVGLAVIIDAPYSQKRLENLETRRKLIASSIVTLRVCKPTKVNLDVTLRLAHWATGISR